MSLFTERFDSSKNPELDRTPIGGYCRECGDTGTTFDPEEWTIEKLKADEPDFYEDNSEGRTDEQVLALWKSEAPTFEEFECSMGCLLDKDAL